MIEFSGKQREKEKCVLLLKQYKKIYEDYKEKERQYFIDLKIWHKQQNDAINNYNKEKHFIKSQLIEWAGSFYNCNSKEENIDKNEKCKCQQLYLNDRSHLFSISPNINENYCNSKEYLTNHNIHSKVCLKHLEESSPSLPYHCDCPEIETETETSGSNQSLSPKNAPLFEEPKYPILYLPTNTCSSCKVEFDTLNIDFSYENIQKVQDCIDSHTNKNEENVELKIMSSSSSSNNNNNPTIPPLWESPFEFQPDIDHKMDHKIKIEDENTKDINQIITPSPPTKKFKNYQIIIISILSFCLFIFAIYIAFSILTNIPYDLPCTKLSLIQQSQENKQRQNQQEYNSTSEKEKLDFDRMIKINIKNQKQIDQINKLKLTI